MKMKILVILEDRASAEFGAKVLIDIHRHLDARVAPANADATMWQIMVNDRYDAVNTSNFCNIVSGALVARRIIKDSI